MLDTTTTRFSHVKPADTAWRSDGLRDFFQYKDLGIEQATAGRVIAQRVRANLAPEKGTSDRASCTTCSTTRPTWSTSKSSVRRTSLPSTRPGLAPCRQQHPGLRFDQRGRRVVRRQIGAPTTARDPSQGLGWTQRYPAHFSSGACP